MAHAQKPDFVFSPKRTSPFKSAGASVQSTAGSRGVRISGSNGGYTTFRGSVIVLATHSIRQFPLYFLSRASPCAIRFQTHSTIAMLIHIPMEWVMSPCRNKKTFKDVKTAEVFVSYIHECRRTSDIFVQIVAAWLPTVQNTCSSVNL
jgi:hypothetical protein